MTHWYASRPINDPSVQVRQDGNSSSTLGIAVSIAVTVLVICVIYGFIRFIFRRSSSTPAELPSNARPFAHLTSSNARPPAHPGTAHPDTFNRPPAPASPAMHPSLVNQTPPRLLHTPPLTQPLLVHNSYNSFATPYASTSLNTHHPQLQHTHTPHAWPHVASSLQSARLQTFRAYSYDASGPFGTGRRPGEGGGRAGGPDGDVDARIASVLTTFPPNTSHDSQICPICLDPLQAFPPLAALPCLHAAHAECLNMWLRKDRNLSCPVCRVPAQQQLENLGVQTSSPLLSPRRLRT